MTPKILPARGLPTDALPDVVVSRPHRRPLRSIRQRAAWLLLLGWVVLPLLPVLGLGLSVLLGVGLF
jgi:hypothetical protein